MQQRKSTAEVVAELRERRDQIKRELFATRLMNPFGPAIEFQRLSMRRMLDQITELTYYDRARRGGK